ncbi:ferritin family protein [bacterium]|nr:ferritin family protein [bacterium]MBU1063635.1 ferritin family protein [bacterium]MBU1633707.1 ferritin family protein [bacterium]MBU1875129.1 ferritin family protein [bacterium]
MDRQKFGGVLDFAIEREKEAVTFYNDLIKLTKSFDIMETIRTIELMERNHIKVIEKMKSQEIGDVVIRPVNDLKISEYLVLPEEKAPYNYQDLLINAMKREELSHKLYVSLAEEIGDTEVKKVFQKLASEEAKHKLTFENLYDNDILVEN